MSEAPLLPGAEPFAFDGGPTGVLLIHGFTGSPVSTRPLGEALGAAGFSVAGVRLPGHGTSRHDLATTRWTDWLRAADEALTVLRRRCERVAVFAQSMGGSIAIHLAASRPGDVAGLVLANPYVRDPRLAVVPVARFVLRSWKGVGNDIRKPGVDEGAYGRIPVAALAELRRLLRLADAELPSVTAPVLVFRSGTDHTIPRSNARRVLNRIGSARRELVACANSFHVVTLDYDAPLVAERTIAFVRSLEVVSRAG